MNQDSFDPVEHQRLLRERIQTPRHRTAGADLYDHHAGNHPTIHANRFPAWSELSEKERQEWETLAARPLHPLQAITDAPPLVPAYESQGTAFDPQAGAHELQGRLLDRLETSHPTLPRSLERTIIAFTGKAGSGKSTAAFRLVNHHGFNRMRFAGPLKSMLAALGLSVDQVDGDKKEVPCDLLGGRTPRHAMQTLGTEWGRELIAPDLWIRAWHAAVARTLPGSCIVVDDCRFPNEAAAIKSVSGLIVHIDRPGAGSAAAGHASEHQTLPFDVKISNHGSVDEFHAEIDALARSMTWAAAGAT